MPKPDYRSAEAAGYRRLYKTARWRGLAQRVFRRDLYTCQQTGVLLPFKAPHPRSPVAHHKKPHHGKLELFFDETNVETVSKEWHDGAGQQKERRGYSTAIGEDGWPTDPEHPANR